MNMIAMVAPHAGAWIETIIDFLTCLTSLVAPHAGAWIETNEADIISTTQDVAPHAGAWIETPNYWDGQQGIGSLLMQERGLKQSDLDAVESKVESLLMQERGLKQLF